tara:strand:- start:17766 stop:20705 length:2940 start_codon:yes stop_codon:yes gene_type:complete
MINRPRTLSVFLILVLLSLGILNSPLYSQKKSDEAIAKLIANYKTELRGPYKDIRWFCTDGSTVAPQERCAEPGGVQRARYREEVEALAKSNHIFFGQILSATETADFWDASNAQSRMKQYQLEQYLRATDQGWINRKAQFYRGAYQVEDEEAWGLKFLTWVVSDSLRLKKHYFLIRMAAKDIPHAKESNLALKIRALSKEIAEKNPSFMNVRVKIHGQPDKGDIQKVEDYKIQKEEFLSQASKESLDQLIRDMESYYQPISVSDFEEIAKNLPANSKARLTLENFLLEFASSESPLSKLKSLTSLAFKLRNSISSAPKASDRLKIIDALNKLELMINKEAANSTPVTLIQLEQRIVFLAKAATGLGYLEPWEFRQLDEQVIFPKSTVMINKENTNLGELNNLLENGRRAVEWGTGMVRATYQDVVKTYQGFEPLSAGFTDDRVRSSVLLPLGNSVSDLGDFFASIAGFSNELMAQKNQSSARGLNPGYAKGILVVSTANPEDIEVESNKIYVFDRPPADLKPVAGIATVSEGNMVSHVQLLARNLGIPNAVVSKGNLESLKAYSGREVFYAVSPGGRVILKPAEEMSPTEKALFTKKVRNEEKITVPVELMELKEAKVLNLRDVNASFSGKVCGPKAANLGELKSLFPENVVEGLVIPFAIFKTHFDQIIPGMEISYWQFLNETFTEMRSMESSGIAAAQVENYVLGRLEILRKEILKMKLLPELKEELKAKFIAILGADMGKLPVFIRSDTNMEDLKDFTGAGLNLTVFNVLTAEKIFQGIKEVWASPYTERSYKWRQKYLLNPENVFPSILIIPTINSDCSGVMITKGVSSGNKKEVTVAFSRGVGGAVEGQASETWLMDTSRSDILLSPSREPDLTTVPVTGGTAKKHTSFEMQILDKARRDALSTMAAEMQRVLPQAGINGPYDVELGFTENKIWLFQVRPFVENKAAAGSEYLQSITETFNAKQSILLKTKLK